MQRRGWILIVAAVLGAAAVTAALAPAPRDDEAADEAPPPPTEPQRRGTTRELDFNATSPAVEEVARGTHVVIRVQAPRPAEVTIPALGLSGFVEPRAPAVFDILADRTGRFDITIAAAEGEARRAGTLVVR